MTDTDFQMFGMSQEDIRSQYYGYAQLAGYEIVVMGILSDCQEMMAMKNPTIASPNTDEFIRKQMNVAKFILGEMLAEKREAKHGSLS